MTLGTSSVTLNDTAVLSGGYHENGSITFTLYLGSTLVDTETAAVSGNGSYTTPTGYTLPTTGTVTGTYQWDASYNGDSNNNSASENNATAEQVVVTKALPAIVTTPSVASVTLGTSLVTLNDTAVLSAGYHENGSITFTLYLGSTLLDTETASVSGNGSYTTPTGYTLPTTGTVTGTYQWDASYNGDSNNNSASENNATAEQVVVSKALPAIATTPSVASVTLGTSSVTLNDTAVLSVGITRTARSRSRSTSAARWLIPRRPRSAATEVTRHPPGTHCRRPALSPGPTSGMPVTTATPTTTPRARTTPRPSRSRSARRATCDRDNSERGKRDTVARHR